MKIKTRFILFMMIFVIFVFMIMYFISLRISKNRIMEDIGNHINTAVKFKAYNLGEVLNNYIEFTELVASGFPFIQYFNTGINKEERENKLKLRIDTIIKIRDSISSIRILDSNGIVVISSHEDVGLDNSAKKIFTEGRKGSFISDLHFSEFTEDYVNSIAVPIHTKGSVSGVLVVNFVAEKYLYPIMADRTGLSDSTNFYLLNKDLLLLTPTGFADKIMETKIIPEQINLCQANHLKSKIPDMDLVERPEYINYRGNKVMGTHIYLPQMQWFLILEVNQKDIMRPIMKYRNILTILFSVLLLLSLGTSYLISIYLTKPIKKLETGVLEIINGNTDHKVATKSKDEIGQLSRVFDEMTGRLLESQKKLKDHAGSLEKQVKERTKELEEKVAASMKQRHATLNVAADLKLEISERKLTEEALKENEEKLRLMIENSPIGFSATDLKGNFIEVNPAVCDMIGFSSEEIIHKHFDQFSHPDDRKQNEVLYKKLLENKIPHFDLEKRYIHKNGNIINVFIRSQIVRDDKGKSLFEMAITEDITLRKKAEEEIRKLSTAVTQSPSVIAITDIEGKLEYVNPKFTELTGYTYEEAKGINPRILKSGEQPDEIYKELWETISSGKVWRGEFHNKKKNGDLFWEAASLSPIFDEQGNISNFIKVAEDITVRKLAEEQIKKDLKIRTALLQELYHRTKNNMQVISSMLKIQLRNIDNRVLSGSEGIEYMHDSFNEIINKIKAMSLVHEKLYQAKDLFHINLKEYIEELVIYLMRSYNIRSEKVILKMELEDVFVLIDSAIPLGLVLNEMVSNVFKHAFPHTKRDELSIKLYKEEDETINIDLSDNGVGLPNDLDLRNVNTMGVQTLFSLTEHQLMGKVEYDTKKGLNWHISFKDNTHKERV